MIGARYQRHSGGAGDLASFKLVAHHRNILGARADEVNFVFRARLRQCGALGKKSVARMKRVAAGALRRRHQILDLQITIGRARRADADRSVGHLRGHAFAVRVRNGGNCFNPQTLASPDDTHGDFAAVGDQYASDPHEDSGKYDEKDSGDRQLFDAAESSQYPH